MPYADPVKQAEFMRTWEQANRDKRREQRRNCSAETKARRVEYTRQWRAQNPEKARAASRRHRAKHLEKRRLADRNQSFKKHYGITLAERDQLLQSQGGVCAVCTSDSPASKKGWHVDHCHKTGKIRGILCCNCNVALGNAKECPERLRRLADYIEAHSG